MSGKAGESGSSGKPRKGGDARPAGARAPGPLRVGGLVLPNPILPAPLAGFTDSGFRVLLASYGASLVYTEMLSAGGIVHDPKGSEGYLRTRAEEGPVAFQLVGGREDWMALAARRCADAGAVLVDVNAGCTDANVNKQGGGATLLRRPDKLCSIVRAVRSASGLPVTVKMRIPHQETGLTAGGVGRLLEDAGAELITLHARRPSARFRGDADWSHIRELKESVSVPVVGNGDVRSARDAARMLAQTGCDGVMVGRAMLGAPWLPGRIWEALCGGDGSPPSDAELADVIFDHAAMKLEDKGDRRAALEMRYMLAKYLRGRRVPRRLWDKSIRVSSYAEILEVVGELRSGLARG